MYERRDPFAFDSWHPVRGAFPTAILGNLETRTFELVQLLDVPPNLHQTIAERNLCFIGIVGLVNGVPRSAFEMPIDNAAIAEIVAAYLQIVEAGMAARLEIALLERMCAMLPSEYDA